jgi:signal transduction histidine kinase
VVFGGSIYLGVQRYLEDSLRHSLADEAKSIAITFVNQFEAKGNTWLTQELTESYPQARNAQIVRLSRVSPGNEYQVLYPPAEPGESGPEKLILPAMPPAHTPEFRRVRGDNGSELFSFAFPYKSASGAEYLIETAAPYAPIAKLLRDLLLMLLILTPIVVVAAGIGGYLLMSQPLKPVVSVTQKAERIGVGELGERLPVIPTGDELERLSHALNRMIDRLETALDHNRRFSADVSHELRTPLTILRGELEHVIQMPGLQPEVSDPVGSALEEIERLAKIVETLLAISRLDSGGAGIEYNPFDLDALSRATAEQMQLLACEKHITVECTSTGPVQAMGDQTRIKQVLVNLLDNAVKYTPANGHVTVGIQTEGDSAVLTVSDDGAGIPAEALPHVFERFYRAEKARSRGVGGFGLGLPLVEAVCRAHGGAVSIESVEGKGTSVTVKLPLVQGHQTATSSGVASLSL